MSKKHKERQRQFWEKNGILGELNLGVHDILLIEKILEKLQYFYHRQSLQVDTYIGITGHVVNTIAQDFAQLHSRFARLAGHLRTQERLRLGLAEQLPVVQDEGDYSG